MPHNPRKRDRDPNEDHGEFHRFRWDAEAIAACYRFGGPEAIEPPPAPPAAIEHTPDTRSDWHKLGDQFGWPQGRRRR